MTAYEGSKELEDLANGIIMLHQRHLLGVQVSYMFRPLAAISNGKVIAGMCIRVDDRNWSIHKNDFLIEIAKDVWEAAPTDEFRLALMDHELSHAGVRRDEDDQFIKDPISGRIRTYIRRHDIEEFEEVLERHGAYHKDLRSFLEAFEKSKIKTPGKTEGEEKAV